MRDQKGIVQRDHTNLIQTKRQNANKNQRLGIHKLLYKTGMGSGKHPLSCAQQSDICVFCRLGTIVESYHQTNEEIQLNTLIQLNTREIPSCPWR